MGAHPYWYFVKYQPDVQKALDELREAEFQAGRYHPVTPFPDFPVRPGTPRPGARHRSIEEAIEDAAEDGTRSILDIQAIADSPDFFVVAPLARDDLESLYRTPHPSREMIEENMAFLENVERGHGVYIIVYKDGLPDELFFGGYSFD
jgi:hypothetical protein